MKKSLVVCMYLEIRRRLKLGFRENRHYWTVPFWHSFPGNDLLHEYFAKKVFSELPRRPLIANPNPHARVRFVQNAFVFQVILFLWGLLTSSYFDLKGMEK